ncbi:MAG: hypothetical protein PHV13_03370 [Candidatus ainarchaeum sp.]|nr:hypothetical protein [Candidatus ainarchaeum sp.]
MFARPLFLLLALAALSFSVTVISPQAGETGNGDIVDLGTIGPGQTVSILVDRAVTTGGIHGTGGMMDQAIATDLPPGWATQPSKLYQDPLQVTVSANPDAPEGNYTFRITVIDENNGEKLGNITFLARVKVTWDVMEFDVLPTRISVGPGQPARFTITVTNKGSASDAFEVSATGSRKWDFKKPVFVPAQTTKTLHYEIVGAEEDAYTPTIRVVSLASGNIAAEKNVTMTVRSDLFGDWKATNHGALLFPIFEAPVYALAGLLSNFFG